jgi:hypothetical protein
MGKGNILGMTDCIKRNIPVIWVLHVFLISPPKKKKNQGTKFEKAPFSIGDETYRDVMISEGVFWTLALLGMKQEGMKRSWDVSYGAILQKDKMYRDITCRNVSYQYLPAGLQDNSTSSCYFFQVLTAPKTKCYRCCFSQAALVFS